jgi:hypothetical protein
MNSKISKHGDLVYRWEVLDGNQGILEQATAYREKALAITEAKPLSVYHHRAMKDSIMRRGTASCTALTWSCRAPIPTSSCNGGKEVRARCSKAKGSVDAKQWESKACKDVRKDRGKVET